MPSDSNNNQIPPQPQFVFHPVSQRLNEGKNIVSRITPQLHLPITNGNQLINQISPALAIKTFGIQILEKNLYQGRIPFNSDRDEMIRKSSLGTPLFSDLSFLSVEGLDEAIPVDIALFSVHQAKNIVRTQINGRDGRIKEYVGLDDYEIGIKGIICGKQGLYPWEQVQNLVQYLTYGQSLGIVSKFLNEIFNINEIVVYDFKMEQTEGSQSHQAFTIEAWDEKPVEILIQEGNLGNTQTV